jgi:hypothetical protein
MKRLLLAAMILGGCGGDGPSLDGTWGVQVNQFCAGGWTFDTKGGTYASELLCTLGGNRVGNELETGTATYGVDSLTVFPKRASCPTSEHVPEAINYSFDNGRLILTSTRAGVTFVLERVPEGGTATAVIVTGCADPTGFVPHPVDTLP